MASHLGLFHLEHRFLLAQAAAFGSTFWLFHSALTTSFIFVPSLLRPLEGVASSSVSPPKSPSETRPSSSLNVPQTPVELGRLTPQVSTRGFDFGLHLGSSGTYKAVAQQFARMHHVLQRHDNAAYVMACSSLAYAFGVHWKGSGQSMGQVASTKWAVTISTLGAGALLQHFAMVPLAHKIARIAGDEEKVEPYEDAPIDREAEKSNTVKFIESWNALNTWRAAIATVALAGLASLRI